MADDRLNSALDTLAPSVDSGRARAIFEHQRRKRRTRRLLGRTLAVTVVLAGVGAAAATLVGGADSGDRLEATEVVTTAPPSTVTPSPGVTTPGSPPPTTPPSVASEPTCRADDTRLAEEIRFRSGEVRGIVTGTVGVGNLDYYRLEAVEGQHLMVHIRSTAHNASIAAWSPRAALDTNGDAAIDTLLADSGEHLICVASTGGDADYELTVSITDPAVPGETAATDPGGGPLRPDDCPVDVPGRFNHTEGTESHSDSLTAGQHALAFIWVLPGQTLLVEVTSTAGSATLNVRGPHDAEFPAGRLLVDETTRAEIVGEDEGWHDICVSSNLDTDLVLSATLSSP